MPRRVEPCRNPRRLTFDSGDPLELHAAGPVRATSPPPPRPGRPGPDAEPASSDQDEVGVLVPPDDDGVPGAEARPAGRAGDVLAADDQLARQVGVDSVFGLVAQIGALVDPARDGRPAGDGASALVASSRARLPAARAGPRPSRRRRWRGRHRGRSPSRQLEAAVGLDGRPPRAPIERRDATRDRVGHADEVGDEAIDRPLVELRRARPAAGSGRRA